MNQETRKFVQISKIFSQFTEKNKQNLIRTAQSLLRVQDESKAMIVSNRVNKDFKVKAER